MKIRKNYSRRYFAIAVFLLVFAFSLIVADSYEFWILNDNQRAIVIVSVFVALFIIVELIPLVASSRKKREYQDLNE